MGEETSWEKIGSTKEKGKWNEKRMNKMENRTKRGEINDSFGNGTKWKTEQNGNPAEAKQKNKKQGKRKENRTKRKTKQNATQQKL